MTNQKNVISQEDLRYFQTTFEECKAIQEGKLADYIPELNKVSPDLFAMSFIHCQGGEIHLGEQQCTFSLQSTQKPFSFAFLKTILPENAIRQKIGVEPSGEAFNSIIELEKKFNRPFNPMINSGAIAVSGLIENHFHDESLSKFQKFLGSLAVQNSMGENFHKTFEVDLNIFQSEKNTANRNRAILYLLKHFHILEQEGEELEKSLDLYFQLCSIKVNTRTLALLAHGLHPDNSMTHSIISRDQKIQLMNLMFTCGMYDTSGEWAYDVGLPAKSGVSGAFFVIIPKVGTMAIYSPLIDEHGHSVRSMEFIKKLRNHFHWQIF